MIKKMIYLVCLLLGLPLFAEEDSALLPDVVYVDCAYWGENGEMTGDYNTPYNTIQQGVDSVNTNGVVIVAPGTYEGALSITNAPLTLLASGSAIDTVITRQWGDNGTIVNIGSNAAGSSIIGFTIQGGFGEVGANLSCNGSVDIKDCVIKDNAYNYYEHDTGSVYVGGENVIVNMENCLVIGTCFGWCSVIFVDGDGETGAVLRIDRSTILASNYYEGTSNIICADGNSIIKCHNSILGGCLESDNTVLFALGGAYDGNPPQFEVAYSCIEGEVGFDAYSDLNVIDGGGNIFCDPCFVDRYSSNFTIEEWSPCRDAANEDLPLDPDGSRVDMGYSETRFGIGKIFNSDEFFYELSEEGAVITLVSNKTEHVAFPMMIDGKVVVGIGQEYGESVFADPTSVVTVDIPSTVK